MKPRSNTSARRHAESEERRHREAALDRTIEQSFPASDPPSPIRIRTRTTSASRLCRAMETRVPSIEPGRVMEVSAQPRHSAGDRIPQNCQLIQVHVAELKQLFNAIDPAPFRQRDLDPDAEDFIVGWAREMPVDAPLALDVHLDRPAGIPEEPAILRDAIREFFGQRVARRRLRELFRRGRTSLVIGITFLAVSLLLGEAISRLLGERRVGEILRESLLIGGWVAMWRPMEVFLYDWWPIRADARLADRLSAMPVRISYEANANSDAWRSDWPAAPPPLKPRADAERSQTSEGLKPGAGGQASRSA